LKSSRLAAHPSTQEEEKGGGRFFIKNELIRKKSKTTFKLFTSLGNNKILSHISGNDSRPRTASANNSHPIQNALANGSTSKSFSTSSGSSLKSQHSGESRMTLQSLASSHEESTPNLISPGQSLLRKHASFEQPSTLFSNEQRYFSVS
jgi:hypothetical protein